MLGQLNSWALVSMMYIFFEALCILIVIKGDVLLFSRVPWYQRIHFLRVGNVFTRTFSAKNITESMALQRFKPDIKKSRNGNALTS